MEFSDNLSRHTSAAKGENTLNLRSNPTLRGTSIRQEPMSPQNGDTNPPPVPCNPYPNLPWPLQGYLAPWRPWGQRALAWACRVAGTLHKSASLRLAPARQGSSFHTVLSRQPGLLAHRCVFGPDEHRPSLAHSRCVSVCTQACLWKPPGKADLYLSPGFLEDKEGKKSPTLGVLERAYDKGLLPCTT